MNIVICTATWYDGDQDRIQAFEDRLRHAAEGHRVIVVSPGGDLTGPLQDADVFFPFSGRTLTEDLIAAAPRLQWLHLASAGVEHALFPELLRRPIVVTNGAGVYAVPIAEHALAMMLALSRGIPAIVRRQDRRKWRGWIGDELLDATALVLGLGGIGRRVAVLCRGVGMRVLAVRRHPENPDPDADLVAGPDALPDLLPQADWLIVCAPATPESTRMIGAAELALMKPTARLVNVSRGSLVDEEALVEALRRGRLLGAALDVFEQEPLPADSPLWEMENVIVSPHTSGSSSRSLERTLALFLDNVNRFVHGQPLRNVVRKNEGY